MILAVAKRTERKVFFAACGAAALLAQAGQAGTVTVDLGATGLGQPFNILQPSLALTALVQNSGDFNDFGKVKWFAGNFAPSGYMLADGAMLDIVQNQVLFSKIGTQYGGDGRSTFALPDLRGRAITGTSGGITRGTTAGAVSATLTQGNIAPHDHQTAGGASSVTGNGDPFSIAQPTIALDAKIITQGTYPGRSGSTPADSSIGFVYYDAELGGAGPNTDPNSTLANGATQSIANNQALYSIIGATYGGDGRSTMDLPDVSDRLVTGTGTGAGLTPRQLGQETGNATETMDVAELPQHDHALPGGGSSSATGGNQPINLIQPELALNYVIAIDGLFPSRGPGSGLPSGENFLGEIALFAGNFAPGGWAFAEGQILQIAQFQALFSLLGTQFGGDGRRTFALPDLRGRVPVGVALVLPVGGTFGAETASLGIGQLPSHTHQITQTAAVPLPAPVLMLLGGLGALLGLRRRQG